MQPAGEYLGEQFTAPVASPAWANELMKADLIHERRLHHGQRSQHRREPAPRVDEVQDRDGIRTVADRLVRAAAGFQVMVG